MDLHDRLADLCSVLHDVPPAEREALDRLVGRLQRDYWLRVAIRDAGGVAGLLRLLRAQAWRIRVWLERGSVPVHANPALVAVLNAVEAGGSLPCERQLRRIAGHGMSEDL